MTVQNQGSPRDRGPDYERLVWLLTRLHRIPDGLGETVLTPQEAAQIRACGFEARAGCVWRCPLLPDELVWGNPLLAHLSEKADPFWRGRRWNPKRAAVRAIGPIDPLSKRERQLLRLLHNAPNQRLSRRDLQRRVSRRIPTWFLDHMLNRLSREDRITLHDGWIFSF